MILFLCRYKRYFFSIALASLIIHGLLFLKKTWRVWDNYKRDKISHALVVFEEKQNVKYRAWQMRKHYFLVGVNKNSGEQLKLLLKPRKGMVLIAYQKGSKNKAWPLCRIYTVSWRGQYNALHNFLRQLTIDHPDWLLDKVVWGVGDDHHLRLKLIVGLCYAGN